MRLFRRHVSLAQLIQPTVILMFSISTGINTIDPNSARDGVRRFVSSQIIAGLLSLTTIHTPA